MKKKISEKLNHFEVIDMGDIYGGVISGGGSCKGTVDCATADAVWCKVNDGCGASDKLCIPGLPKGLGHDGCCSGTWDHMGDGRADIVVLIPNPYYPWWN